jgi:hypothetical protein
MSCPEWDSFPHTSALERPVCSLCRDNLEGVSDMRFRARKRCGCSVRQHAFKALEAQLFHFVKVLERMYNRGLERESDSSLPIP